VKYSPTQTNSRCEHNVAVAGGSTCEMTTSQTITGCKPAGCNHSDVASDGYVMAADASHAIGPMV